MLACGALALMVIFAITGRSPTHRAVYRVIFKEDVTGLSNGSKVLFKGVECGRVTQLVVDQNETAFDVLVTIELRPDAIPPLREGVYAQLAPVGVSGLMRIVLHGGSPDAPLLKPGSTLPSRPSFLTELTQNLPMIQQGIQEALDVITHAVSEIDKHDVQRLVRETSLLAATLSRHATDAISAATDALRTYLALGRRLETSLPAAAEAFTGAAAAARDLFNEARPHVGRLGPELSATLKEAREAMAVARAKIEVLDTEALEPRLSALVGDVTRTLEGFNDMTEAVRLTALAVDREFHSVSYEAAQLLAALRDAMHAVERLADYLERDPAALLRGKSAPDAAARRAK